LNYDPAGYIITGFLRLDTPIPRGAGEIRTKFNALKEFPSLLRIQGVSESVAFLMTDAMMSFVIQWNISKNGLFVVVDFMFGFMRSFPIAYNGKNPSDIVPLYDFRF
jgi:hypothetical protein